MATKGMYCGHCGALNPRKTGFCVKCGQPLAAAAVAAAVPAAAAVAGAAAPVAYAYQPAVYPQGVGGTAAAHQPGRPSIWILAGVGALVVMVILGGLAFALRPQTTFTCQPPCQPPPPAFPPLAAPQSYTSTDFGFSLDYSPGLAGIQEQRRDSKSIVFQGGGGEFIVFGANPAGHSAQQLIDAEIQHRFPGAQPAYQEPGAELGYYNATGWVYDLQAGGTNGQSQHLRVVAVAAVRNGVAVVALAVGPFIADDPQVVSHPLPAETPVVEALDPVLNTVRWRGDPVR